MSAAKREQLQAVLLADTFATRFAPITNEKPKALLPLVNVPMLDYTLEFLSQGGVKVVYVLCRAHAKQIEEYIEIAKGRHENLSKMVFNVIPLDDAYGTGDALRRLHRMDVIHSDPFVLMTCDTVSNIDLASVVAEQRARAKADKRNILTCVFNQASFSHRTRSKEDEVILAIESSRPPTKKGEEKSNEDNKVPESSSARKHHSSHGGRLLVYQNTHGEHEEYEPEFDLALFEESPEVAFHSDLMDCQIDVCSRVVLDLFSDNFDYQHLRKDFLKGVLESDILGLNIHAYVANSAYAARVHDLRTYNAVSKDIVQRWTYPICPDSNILHNSSFELRKNNVYRERDVVVDRSASLGHDVVLGEDTSVGANSSVDSTVIGRNCKIGKNVTIKDSYLWDNVTIEDGCHIDSALLCGGVTVRADSKIKRGSVLSYNVEVSSKSSHPPFTVLTTQTSNDDDDWGSDDDDEGFGDDEPDSTESKSDSSPANRKEGQAEGAARRFSYSEIEDEFDYAACALVDGYVPPSGESSDTDDDDDAASDSLGKAASPGVSIVDDGDDAGDGSGDGDGGDSDLGDSGDDAEGEAKLQTVDEHKLGIFISEVSDTIKRGETSNLDVDSVALEIKSLKLSSNIVNMDDFTASIIIGLFACLDPQPTSAEKLTAKVGASLVKLIKKWHSILTRFTRSEADQKWTMRGLERACAHLPVYIPLFTTALNTFYDEDTLSEDVILAWHAERKEADAAGELTDAQRKYLAASAKLIEWLEEADEESEEGDSDEDDSE